MRDIGEAKRKDSFINYKDSLALDWINQGAFCLFLLFLCDFGFQEFFNKLVIPIGNTKDIIMSSEYRKKYECI